MEKIFFESQNFIIISQNQYAMRKNTDKFNDIKK